MTNTTPLWQGALKGFAVWTILVHLGPLALMIVAAFIRWDLEGFTMFDWTDVRVCLVIAFVFNVMWLRDGSSKLGGKREWHQATADKFAEQGE